MIETDTYKDRTWFKLEDDQAFNWVFEDWYNGLEKMFVKHIKQYGVAVQAGGYCGYYPRLLAEKFRVVYTFEPDPINFECLVRNCNVDNIVKMQAALGSKHEMVLLNRQSAINKGMNVVKPYINGIIPTLTIDDLNLSACDFIQLDTEGYEIEILKGAKETISKFVPLISVENNNKVIQQFLNDYNYVILDQYKKDTLYRYF
jgi:FkbM family methyltransferase